MIVGYSVMKIRPEYSAGMQKLATEEHAVKKTVKGFKNEFFFANWETNVFGAFGIWETKEDREAWRKIRPKDQDDYYRQAIVDIIADETYELIEID